MCAHATRRSLYQVSDRQLFEAQGVDFAALISKTDFLGRAGDGRKYTASMNELGSDVQRVIDGRGFQSADQRDQMFQQFVGDGAIVPLTSSETQYYRNTFESGEQSLESPYQSTEDAMYELGKNLATGFMYLGQNETSTNNATVATNTVPEDDNLSSVGTGGSKS